MQVVKEYTKKCYLTPEERRAFYEYIKKQFKLEGIGVVSMHWHADDVDIVEFECIEFES